MTFDIYDCYVVFWPGRSPKLNCMYLVHHRMQEVDTFNCISLSVALKNQLISEALCDDVDNTHPSACLDSIHVFTMV